MRVLTPLALAGSLILAANLAFAATTATRGQSATPLGEIAYQKALWALEHASKVHYKHAKKHPCDQIEESLMDGTITSENDCSGFASWVLHHTSPDRLWAVEKMQPANEVPLPKTFARFFASLPTDKESEPGWIGVSSPLQLRRGDFIAWDSPSKHGDSGNVMIVAATPGQPEETVINGRAVRYVSVRVIDSSKSAHFDPEVLPPLAQQSSRNGLGEGYVRIAISDDGKPGEHWDSASESAPTISPIIGLGRLVGQAHFPKIRSADLNFRPNSGYMIWNLD